LKSVPPSVCETAFNCPHCGALVQQFWSLVYARRLKSSPKSSIENLQKMLDKEKDPAQCAILSNVIKNLSSNVPFIVQDCEYEHVSMVGHMYISRCHNCTGLAVWIRDRMVYPSRGEAPPANPDLPPDIRRDYDEASSILDLSPRGAAALIRLAVQKLCRHLGQPGENLNDDIGTLTKNGLAPTMQQAFDAVRVMGNNAVHPGQIDMRDDRATAATLFSLVNLIADRLLSEPKRVQEMYDTLPEDKRQAIEKRDA